MGAHLRAAAARSFILRYAAGTALFCSVILTHVIAPAVHAEDVGDALLVSRSEQSAPADGETSEVAASPNSDILLFTSRALNLDGRKTLQNQDIFRVGIGSSGRVVPQLFIQRKNSTGQDDGALERGAESPSVSRVASDGRTFAVAFASRSLDAIARSAAVPDPMQQRSQVFLRVMPSGEHILLSKSIVPQQFWGSGDSTAPKVAMLSESPLAYRVAFLSDAPDLVRQGVQSGSVVHSFVATVFQRSSSSGWEVSIKKVPNVDSESEFRDLSISADGTKIIYSTANIELGSDGARVDTYVQDASGLSPPELVCPYARASHLRTFGGSLSYSGDVRVFLMSRANNTSGDADVYMTQVGDNTTTPPTQINVAEDGTVSNGRAMSAQVSPGGDYAAFSDVANNLVSIPGAEGIQASQAYLKNLSSGLIWLISAQPSLGSSNYYGRGGMSDLPVIGGASLSSRKVSVAFVSDALNLAGESSGGAIAKQAYRVVAERARPPLYEGAPISVPPDVEVRGRRVVITLQEFSLSVIGAAGLRATTGKVRYSVEIQNKTTRKRIRLVTTRNRVTVRKLSPGRYTVRYRASASGPGGKVVKSKYSPKAPMTIT